MRKSFYPAIIYHVFAPDILRQFSYRHRLAMIFDWLDALRDEMDAGISEGLFEAYLDSLRQRTNDTFHWCFNIYGVSDCQ